MCPWKVDAIQKRVDCQKRFVDSKNSTVSDSVLLFAKKLYLIHTINSYNIIVTVI